MSLVEQAKAILNEPETKERNRRMFDLHNQIFPDKPERTKWCGACVKRVTVKLQNYINHAG